MVDQYKYRNITMKKNKTHGGLTLLECLAVLFILALLASLALPMLKFKHSGDQVANALHRHLELAKSHSVKTQKVVTVCPSADGLHCSQDWQQGYIVLDASGKVLRHVDTSAQLEQFFWRGLSANNRLHFDVRQNFSGLNGHFYLKNTENSVQKVIINGVGRVRVDKVE